MPIVISSFSRFTTICLLCLWFQSVSAFACESFIDTQGRSSVNLALLPGYFNVCSKDEIMCFLATADSPKSLTTLGVFTSVEEWDRSKRFEVIEHSRGMLAQRARTMTTQEFRELKDSVRKEANEVNGRAHIGALQLKEAVALGVIHESHDSISTAVLARLTPPTDGGLLKGVTLITIRTLLQIKDETLSLETTEQWMFPFYSGPEPSAESTTLLAKQWLECIRSMNN
jgi:hypothetical protein